MKSATFSNVSFMHGQAQAVATTGRAPEGDLKLPVKWVLSFQGQGRKATQGLGRYH